jgi:regulator of ribonuclease activity A
MTPPPAGLATTDLCDKHPDAQVCEPIFQAYGGVPAFAGPITTLKVFEDNTMVREAVGEAGQGRVLVVDGGASRRCSLFGGNLAVAAAKNGWAGVVVNGCVRDVDELAAQPIGVRALAAFPRRSERAALGPGRAAGAVRGGRVPRGRVAVCRPGRDHRPAAGARRELSRAQRPRISRARRWVRPAVSSAGVAGAGSSASAACRSCNRDRTSSGE